MVRCALTIYPYSLTMLPVLIGHGAGTETSEPPILGNHTLSSSGGSVEKLQGEGNISITIDGVELLNADLSSQLTHDEITFFLNDGDILAVEYQGLSAVSKFGELWLVSSQPVNLAYIKLLHSIIVPSQYKASFSPMESELNAPQSSQNASMSGYILSGGPTGSEPLAVTGNLNVFLDDLNIYSETNTAKSPIAFAANGGQILRFSGESPGASGVIGEIWLHTPDGSGIKLSHSIVSSDGNSCLVDAYYSLP